jgi:choice-of-anchor C domain-containing protein
MYMDIKKGVGYLATAVALGAASMSANANLVANGSFESGSYCGNSNFCTLDKGSTVMDDWTIVAGSVDWINDYWQAADGSKSLDINGGSAGGFSASTSFATLAGQSYLLSFAMSGNPDGGSELRQIAVGITPNAGVTHSTGTSPHSTIFSFDVSAAGHTRANMAWETQSLVFTGLGVPTMLSFFSLNSSAYGAAIDDISVVEFDPQRGVLDSDGVNVPEPATLGLAMLCLGMGGAGFARRRRS